MNQNQCNQLTGAVSIRPATQVENEINNLRAAHDELLKRCRAVRDRFATVLRPMPMPTAPNDGKIPQELLVPLAEILREIGGSAAEAIGILNDIYECAELPIIG